jgi:hypothetical protein
MIITIELILAICQADRKPNKYYCSKQKNGQTNLGTSQIEKLGLWINGYIYLPRCPSFEILLSFSHIEMSSTRSVPRLFRKFTAPFVASRTFLIDNLVVTVFKDSSFDGAATAMVRDYFKRWAATAAQQEEGIGPGRPGNVETILVLYSDYAGCVRLGSR